MHDTEGGQPWRVRGSQRSVHGVVRGAVQLTVRGEGGVPGGRADGARARRLRLLRRRRRRPVLQGLRQDVRAPGAPLPREANKGGGRDGVRRDDETPAAVAGHGRLREPGPRRRPRRRGHAPRVLLPDPRRQTATRRRAPVRAATTTWGCLLWACPRTPTTASSPCSSRTASTGSRSTTAGGGSSPRPCPARSSSSPATSWR